MSCYRQNLFERLSLFNLPNHQRPQSRHRGSLDSQIVRDSRRFCLQESQQRQRLPKRGLGRPLRIQKLLQLSQVSSAGTR